MHVADTCNEERVQIRRSLKLRLDFDSTPIRLEIDRATTVRRPRHDWA